MNAAVGTLIIRAVRNAGLPEIFNLFLFGIGTEDRSCRQDKNHILEPYSREKTACGETGSKGIDYDEINLKVEEWAERHVTATPDFTLGNIAEDIGIPKRVLSRYFEDCLKMDFRLWRSRIRIASAQKMLLEDDMDMSEMAMRLGFKDKSNLHRQFKALVGCTPGQWKNSGGHPEVED